MSRISAHRAFAVIFAIGGALAFAVSNLGLWVPRGSERGAVILASLVAFGMCTAGVIWFFRPKCGIALAAATLIPQVFSFAFGSVGYVLHLWPSYSVELNIPGAGESPFSIIVPSFSNVPEAMLRTDASYIGVGIGIELVSFTVLLSLLFALARQRRSMSSPN